jgi:hypothetical protein
MASEHRGGRRTGLVMLLVTAAAVAASFAAAARGQSSTPQTTTVTEVVVGAVGPSADHTMLFANEENVTFPFVAGKLADQPARVSIPLQTVLGDHAVTLTNVTASVDPDMSSVAFVGKSTNAAGILAGMTTDVLVLLDWQSSTDTKPTRVVSVRTGPRSLGQVLKLLPGETFASDISLSAVAMTVGQSSIDFDSEKEEFAHVAWSFNLTPAAAAFFEPVYTSDGLPRVVPALRDLSKNIHLSAAFPLDVLGDVAADVLGLPAGAGVVVEGGLGVDISGSDEFDAKTVGWSLETLLPRISNHGFPFPYFLDLDTTGRFNLKVAYGPVTSSKEDPKPTAVTVTAGADMTTDLLGSPRSFFAQFQITKTGGDEPSTAVALSVSIDELWVHPFGIDFLSVNDVYIDGTFTRSTDSDGESSTTFEGSVLGYAEVAGVDVTVKLEGKVEEKEISAEFELSLTSPVNVGNLLAGIGGVADLPPSVSGPALNAAAIHIGVHRARSSDDDDDSSTSSTSTPTTSPTTTTTVPGSNPTRISIAASGELALDLPAGVTLAVKAMFSLDKDRKVVAALRSAGALNLSSILEGVGVSMPTFGSGEKLDIVLDDADGSAFGMIYSTADTNTMVNTLPKFAREFYRPLLGQAPDDPLDVPLVFTRGVNVLGSFALPDQIADIVDTLGAQSRVFARGTLPIFDRSSPVSLALGLRLKSSQLPDYIQQVSGSIKLDVVHGPSGGLVKFGLLGELMFRLPAGLPEEAAGPLRSLGIPVETFEAVPPTYACANRQPPLQSRDSTEYRCYDLISLAIDVGFIVNADGVGIDVLASINTPGPDNVYHPFGFEWFAINQAKLHFAQLVTPAGQLQQVWGFLGDVEIGGKDLFVALEIAVAEMAQPPWITFDFKGLKVASGKGLSLSDFFALQHRIATAWAAATGQPEPPRLQDLVQLPDIAVRNLEFTLSPKGVPALCIPQGLVISGDFYIAPTGNEPVGDPDCLDNTSVIPNPGDRCGENRFNGCIASGRMKLSYFGFVGLLEISGFDLGPVHWAKLYFDVAFTYTDQHFIGWGGARLDNFTGVGPDPLMSGEFKILLEPLTMTVFGQVEALQFKALVDMTVGYDILRDLTPEFDLHLLLSTDESDLIDDPSLEAFANETMEVLFAPIRTVAVVANAVLSSFEDNPVRALRGIPSRLEKIGIPVPAHLDKFDREADAFLDKFEDIIDYAPGSFFNLVLNGIPEFGFEGVDGPSFTVCIFWTPFDGCEHEETFCVGAGEVIGDDCWLVPPFEFPGTPGICDAVFPASQFPGLRDSDGDCTRSRIVREVIFPVFEGGLRDLLGFDVNLTSLLNKLMDTRKEPLLALPCAEYFLKVGSGEAFSQLTFVAEVLGQPLGFRLGFDFFDPVNSVPDLFEDLIRQLLNPGSVSCLGYNEVFGRSTAAGPRLTIEVPPVADEGAPVTLVGSFGQPLPEARTVTVAWGDLNVDTIEVPAGQAGFQVTHVHLDDNPTATASDVKRVVATDQSPGGRTAAKTMTLRNVDPVPVNLELLSGPIIEGARAEFELTFTDPGVDDTHWLMVDWGDGRRFNTTLGHTGDPRPRTVRLAHTYRDDDPSGTPADSYDITVTVVDDDTGEGTVVFPFTVHNRAPSDVGLRVTDFNGDGVVEENEPVQLRVTWADAGVLDTHRVSVDWGTGQDQVEVQPVLGARQVVLAHSFGDNGTFLVNVVVTDDDAQSASATLAVTVGNVDPSVGLDRRPTFAAPGGETYMVRQAVPLHVQASAYDPGSDDLTFTWAWGDEALTVDTDRVNPPLADPLPSPTRQPRDIVNRQNHTYAKSCLYWLDLGTDDDDGGRAGDRAPVVVVGPVGKWQSFGWWSEEYRHFGRAQVGQVDDRTLMCHLAVARHMSRVFGEAVTVDTPGQALGVLLPQGGGGGQRALRERQLDQSLLAAWVNLAHGATGTNPEGFIVAGFAQVVYGAEAVRLNPQSTADDLFAAQRAVDAAVMQYSTG